MTSTIVPLKPAVDHSALSQTRILLVDDDPTSRDVLVLLLGRLDHATDVAGDGIEALANVIDVGYEMVFMDVHLPAMDGLEATRRIRSLPPPTPQPVIVAMSANVTAEDRASYRRAGADTVLAKPVRLSELSHLLGLAQNRPGGTPEPIRDESIPSSIMDRHPVGALPTWPAVYDPTVLATLIADVGGDTGHLRRELLGSFLDGADQRVGAIQAAGRDVTGASLSMLVHELKSAAATLGLNALATTALRIDRAFRTAPDRTDVAGEASELLGQFRHAVTAVRCALSDAPSPT